MIKEIESTYNSLSFSVYFTNIEIILKKYPNSSVNIKKIKEYFFSFKVKEVVSNFYSSNFKRKIIRLLLIYNKINSGFEKEILKDFILFLNKGLGSVVNFKISKNTYMLYNFNTKPIFKGTLQDKEYIKDRVLEYASAFYYFPILILIFSVVEPYIKKAEYERFCRSVHNNLNLGIITGFEAYTEIETDFLYGAFVEELLTLNTADKKHLVIGKTPDSQTLEFTVKNSIILQEAYEKYGWDNLDYEEDYSKDKNISNKFRIVRGSTPYCIKFIYKRACGQRTLGRIFCWNAKYSIRINKLYDAGLSCIRNFLFFCLSGILDNCNLKQLQTSNYKQFNSYIKQYKGKRYVPEIISVVTLIALHPELQEEIISKYLVHKGQRDNILSEVNKLRKLLKKPSKSVLDEFLAEMRYYYAW